MQNAPNMTIGKLADAAGVNVETVRFYQRKGLLEIPEKPLGGTRRYSESSLARIRFIKAAQKLGFGLSDIRGLLRLDDGTHCREAAQAAGFRLADVRAKIRDLQKMENVLENLRHQCEKNQGQVSCPLIDALYASK